MRHSNLDTIVRETLIPYSKVDISRVIQIKEVSNLVYWYIDMTHFRSMYGLPNPVRLFSHGQPYRVDITHVEIQLSNWYAKSEDATVYCCIFVTVQFNTSCPCELSSPYGIHVVNKGQRGTCILELMALSYVLILYYCIELWGNNKTLVAGRLKK